MLWKSDIKVQKPNECSNITLKMEMFKSYIGLLI